MQFRRSILVKDFKFMLIQRDKLFTIYESLISKKVRKVNTFEYKVTLFNHCFDIIVRTV